MLGGHGLDIIVDIIGGIIELIVEFLFDGINLKSLKKERRKTKKK